MERDDQEDRLAKLFAGLDSDAAPEDEMDPNDIARLAAGRTSPPVKAAIHARMSAEDASVTAGVAKAAAARHTRTATPPWVWAASIAAALLLAVGSWFVLEEKAAPPWGDADLVAAFDALRQADPETFTGIDPFLAEERSGGAAPLQRGGLRVRLPHGAILVGRPTLAWDAVRGADGYAVQILSDEGEAVLEAQSSDARLAWPADVAPLVPGTEYVLRVTTTVAGVRAEGTRAFRVPGEAEQARYRRALVAIDAGVAADLRAVARAHVALRFGFLMEAKRQLEEVPAASAQALVEETRAHWKRVVGED